MRTAVVLALGGLLFTGPALAECVTPPVTNKSVGAGAGKGGLQKFAARVRLNRETKSLF